MRALSLVLLASSRRIRTEISQTLKANVDMKRTLIPLVAALLLHTPAWAQTSVEADQTPRQDGRLRQDVKPAEHHEKELLIELGGFTNFTSNHYGQWSGANAKVMYRGAKHFAPIFGFASQTRPDGTQTTFGIDSYVLVNKRFYAIAGIGGSPKGSAVLWPKLRYGGTGLITIPRVKGLVGTVGASKIWGERGAYDAMLSAGAMYYRGRSIWSGHISFNRNHPGNVPSKSGGVAVLYGTHKKYWIGAGFSGGRIAYQAASLTPFDVRFVTFGPTLSYTKWVTPNRGFSVRYDYQHQVNAYQRHGIAVSVFFEAR